MSPVHWLAFMIDEDIAALPAKSSSIMKLSSTGETAEVTGHRASGRPGPRLHLAGGTEVEPGGHTGAEVEHRVGTTATAGLLAGRAEEDHVAAQMLACRS